MSTTNPAAALDAALASQEYLVSPHEINHRLRSEQPVHWSDHWQGWMLSRYHDVKFVLHKHALFSSGDQVSRRLEFLLRNAPSDAKAQLMEFWGFQGLFQSDPPSYTRYRSQMIKALTPRLERVEPRVEEIAQELLDRVAPRGHCDLVADFGQVLPATILFELIGIAEDDRATLLRWADTLTQTFADSSGENALASTATLKEAYVWARRISEERRRDPGDDVISLILASDAFGSMTERDVLSTVVFLLTAGQGTLASLIPTCIYLLLAHPDQLEEVVDDPEMAVRAVDETLRYESPIQQLGRTVVEDCSVGGVDFAAGEMVFAMIGAGNRDPEVFANPDEFDIHRDASDHLGFGYGAHFCLGSSLARLEARIAIPLVLKRLRGLRLAGPIQWQPNTAFRSPTTLPVGFDVT